jgi:hypothetical protein
MMARIQVSKLSGLPEAYAAELRAAGKVDGEFILVPLSKALLIRSRYRPRKEAAKVRGLGDVVHMVAKPIAKVLGLSCIDKMTGGLKPQSPCAKRREMLNRAIPFKGS